MLPVFGLYPPAPRVFGADRSESFPVLKTNRKGDSPIIFSMAQAFRM